jgi:hypothetical protein
MPKSNDRDGAMASRGIGRPVPLPRSISGLRRAESLLKSGYACSKVVMPPLDEGAAGMTFSSTPLTA